MQQFYIETKKKKETEEKMMKTQLEKRKMDFEKDFNKKYNEATAICEKLGIEDEVRDEYNRVMKLLSQNKILSRVYVKEIGNDDDVDFKKFLIRKAKKYKEKQASTKLWKDEGVVDRSMSLSPDKKNVRYERQEVIKKYLIEAIRLKNKLKKQITSLREKPVVDENKMLRSLKEMNICQRKLFI